jgi:hypothetical protein
LIARLTGQNLAFCTQCLSGSVKKNIFIFAALILLSSCGGGGFFSGRPREVMTKKQMTSLLMDMQITEVKFRQLNPNLTLNDTTRNYYRFGYVDLFKKHETTPANFRLSMEYYSKRPDILNEIYNDVISNLTEIDAKLHVKKDTIKKPIPPPVKPVILPDSLRKRDSVKIKNNNAADTLKRPVPAYLKRRYLPVSKRPVYTL